MSFVVGTIHPPSCISSVTTVNIGFDVLVLSRGNEILISKITDSDILPPKIFSFFGNISCVSSFGQNKLAALFENETLIIFSLDNLEFKCLNTCEFDYKIGFKIPKFLLATSNNLIVCHTRKRTVQILLPNEPISFTQYLPFSEIYTIKCFDDTSVFLVYGKNLKNSYQTIFYEILDGPKLEAIKSISFPDNIPKPFLITNVSENYRSNSKSFIVSINNRVEIYENYELTKKIEYDHEISSLFLIDTFENEPLLAVCDIKNKVFDLTNQISILKMKNISSIVPIGHNFYFQFSEIDDAHILKYENSILKVYDTYAQINCVSMMNRTSLLLKNGKIRSLVNGSQTAEEVNIEIVGGKRIWSCGNIFAVSTFNSTYFLDASTFSSIFDDDSETDKGFLDRNSKSILIFLTQENEICQVTSKSIRLPNDEKFLEKEAILAENDKDLIAISFDDNSITVFQIADSKISEIGFFSVPFEVSALALNDAIITVAFWMTNDIISYDINNNFNVLNQFAVQEKELISSLIYDDHNNLIIGGCGSLFINTEKIPISNSSIYLRRINNQILAITDTPALIKIHDNNENNNKDSSCKIDHGVEYIEAPASFDAAGINGKIAFLSHKGISILSIENHHHSHIEDRSVIFHNIHVIAVDETNNHCPTVYAVKKDSYFSLVTTSYPPVPLLLLEVPKCMIWIYNKSDFFLIVGCSSEKSGKLIVFDSKLKRLSDTSLSLPVDAVCYVKKKYIAVASGTTLKAYILNNSFNLELKSSEPTRVQCASLTSPNSHAVVYADKVSSVSLYTILKGQISLIARDMNPKALKFARLESDSSILAIGDNSMIYDITFINENENNNGSNDSLVTKYAFNINCEVSAVLSSPDLSFVTKTGSVQVIMKRDEIYKKIYDAMKNRITGLGNMKITDFRKVEKNGKTFDSGKFVDGDFILMFGKLSEFYQSQIAKAVGLKVSEILNKLQEFSDSLTAYRTKHQAYPNF
ncbi:hypothetical protein TRFO_09849 [Tritrichomonas foetus]|uniref:DNA damage-binding protein 1 n=1 Tax=Tritrichomonas foetus TaxID=1144522 RepID=A0A1J4JBX2_9EUKA|nr:hypothetical protein TRFO_09849 [Tritrichomonas foetus]|eukprot:OHS96686.1 hypothetical protein TRFO_09849 [Tritrichomonas foetus]